MFYLQKYYAIVFVKYDGNSINMLKSVKSSKNQIKIFQEKSINYNPTCTLIWCRCPRACRGARSRFGCLARIGLTRVGVVPPGVCRHAPDGVGGARERRARSGRVLHIRWCQFRFETRGYHFNRQF